VRTVRNAARARNRPRKRLAWILVAVLSGLLALAGRALADPPTDEEIARSADDAGEELLEDDFAALSGLVDVTTLRDLQARHARPSRWGRLDLSLAWRRIDRDEPLSTPERRDEVWLFATWRH